MPVAEARAIAPSLEVHDENPPRDRRALERLAIWAERFSPIVSLEEGPAPECLLLDVTGCASCFHGEDRLIQRAVGELHEQGWRVRAAIADTVGAAWALAHHVRSWYVAPAGETDKTLLALPVALLRLPEEALATLADLGIERIGQLLALPRNELPPLSLLSPGEKVKKGDTGLVLERLDQALGVQPEPITPYRSPPNLQARCSFEYPTEQRAALIYALSHLVERVVKELRRRNRGARRMECWLFHEIAPAQRLEVGLFRPSRSPEHLHKLLQTRLEETPLVEPVRGICLRVPIVEMMPQQQGELFDADETRTEELATLIDQLVTRLGREAITFPRLVADPQPEYACRFETGAGRQGSGIKSQKSGVRGQETGIRRKASARAMRGLRMLTPDSCSLTPDSCLLPPDSRPVQIWPAPIPIEVWAAVPEGAPARLRWAGAEYAVVRSWGPERIATGWWRGADIERDYYIVQTDRGSRLWIFRRQEDGRWFLHGTFD